MKKLLEIKCLMNKLLKLKKTIGNIKDCIKQVKITTLSYRPSILSSRINLKVSNRRLNH